MGAQLTFGSDDPHVSPPKGNSGSGSTSGRVLSDPKPSRGGTGGTGGTQNGRLA